MRTRSIILALFAALAVGLVTGPAAEAATSPQKFKRTFQMNGKTKSGRAAVGTFTVTRYVKSKYTGRLVAVGTWKGKVGSKRYTKRNVRAVAKLTKPAAGSALLPDIPNACEVLNLRLEPITLNLLGLVVRTNQINVRIDAVPGAGNLLGNLLCGVVGILDPSMTNGQIARLLNGILAILQPVSG